MTDLEKMREWLRTFPGGIPDNFQVDYTSEISDNAGLFPSGTLEVNRARDILGNTTITNQYNFGLYLSVPKPTDLDEISTANAEWMMGLQRWVQEQSVTRKAPTFGNTRTDREVITAQNGQFYGDKEAGVGIYMVTITVTYYLYFGR